MTGQSQILPIVDAPETDDSTTLRFTNPAGITHGTWDAPITGPLTIDDTGAVEGGIVAVIFRGSSIPAISGGLVLLSGGITSKGLYTIYMQRIAGRYNVTVHQGADVDPPATPLISNVVETIVDSVAPSTPNLISAIFSE